MIFLDGSAAVKSPERFARSSAQAEVLTGRVARAQDCLSAARSRGFMDGGNRLKGSLRNAA